MDDPPKLLAKKLTQQNSTDYDGDDFKPIFDKGMYGAGIFCFDHLNFGIEAYGLTWTAEDIKIARKDEIPGEDGQEEDDDEVCPI